jgi:hypothetical protein
MSTNPIRVFAASTAQDALSYLLVEKSVRYGVSETYILHEAILAIHSEKDLPRIPVMIPIGAKVTLTNGPLDGLRMVDVRWENKTVMMFTSDLRERGKLT